MSEKKEPDTALAAMRLRLSRPRARMRDFGAHPCGAMARLGERVTGIRAAAVI